MKKIIKRLSIKAKIITVLVVVITLATALVAFMRSTQIIETNNLQVRERLESHSDVVLGILGTARDYTFVILETIADLPQVHGAVTGGGSEAANDIMQSFHANINEDTDGDDMYAGFLLFDSNFNLAAANLRNQPQIGILNALNTPFAENAARAREGLSFASSAEINADSGLAEFWMSYPITIDGRFAGMAVAVANTQAFGAMTARVLGETNVNISVADRAGNFFFTNNPAYMGMDVDSTGVESAYGYIPMEVMFEHTSGVTGRDKLAFISNDPAFEWTTVVFYNTDDLENVAWVVFISLLPTVGGIIAAAVFLIIIINLSMKSLSVLAATAKEVAKGNINVNIQSTTKDEVGQVTEAFKEIVESLGVLHDEITEGEGEIRRGRLAHRLDSSKMGGVFGEILEDVNNLTVELMEYIDFCTVCPLVIVDKDYRIQFANGIANKFTGKSNWAGKHANDLFGIDITGNETVNKCLKTGETGSCDLMLTFGTPSNYDMTLNTMPCKSKTGEIVSAVIFLADFTEIRESGRHTEKLNAYRNLRTEKLTETIVNAFEKGDLSINIQKSEYDEDTKSIAFEQDNVEEIVKKATDTIKSYVDEISGVLADIAGGDLTKAITREYMGDFATIKDSINNISGSLNKTMSEIFVVAEQVLTGANQISTSSANIASGAGTQAASVEELTSSVELIGKQTRQNAESAENANGLSQTSADGARAGNDAMLQTLDAMAGIREASGNIGKIIKTIQDIAFQTNLLALNASIEAAHAGEQGRGFAVVADEVRTLASKSQTAAEETTELIENTIQKVEAGSEIAKSTALSLDTIVENANMVRDIIGEISDASRDQAEAIGQVGAGLENISSVVQDNSAVSEEAAAAAQELNSQAEVLRQLVEFFKLK